MLEEYTNRYENHKIFERGKKASKKFKKHSSDPTNLLITHQGMATF